MRFADNEMIIFDIETTDIEACKAAGVRPEIIEIGGIRVNYLFEEQSRWTMLVKPTHVNMITPYLLDLTGLDEDAVLNAPTWKDCWRQWATFTKFNSTRLVSFGQYDTHILSQEYADLRLGYPHKFPAIDAISLLYYHCALKGMTIPSFKLERFCELFNIPQPKKHRALPDAISVMKILSAIVREDTKKEEKFQLFEA